MRHDWPHRHHDGERRHSGPWHRGFGFRPPFPPMGFGHGRGHGGRGGRRANIRPAILALLLERPMHGYEMIQELERRTGGIWRPSPGSVYPMLQLLEDGDLVTAEEREGRRRFTLTDTGRVEAEAAAQNPPWAEFADETVSQAEGYREAIFGILTALKEVGVAGSETQRAKALEILTDTRRRLYAILAEE